MFEGLFQPLHLVIIAFVLAVPLAAGICMFLAVYRLFSVDKSLKAILAELQAQRRS
jgi:ABC-type phosphate transport system permease subunit